MSAIALTKSLFGVVENMMHFTVIAKLIIEPVFLVFP